jgi:hypothetical protein
VAPASKDKRAASATPEASIMPVTIRPLSPASPREIALVARRWEQTLLEVLGPERAAEPLAKGRPWIEAHVRRHVTRGPSRRQ